MPWLLALLLVLLAAISVILFVQHPWWLPPLASLHATSVDHRFKVFFIILGAIFVIGQLVLGALLWRYREGSQEPQQASATMPPHHSRSREKQVEFIGLICAITLFVSLS